jgi:hypothetical protein
MDIYISGIIIAFLGVGAFPTVLGVTELCKRRGFNTEDNVYGYIFMNVMKTFMPLNFACSLLRGGWPLAHTTGNLGL